jgi:ferredoxin
MLVTELKPEQEVLQSLARDSRVFLVGCNGCASACKTGGAENLPRLVELLKGAGKNVTGSTAVDFLCDKSLVRSRLRPFTEQIMASDSVLVATCGIGVQCVGDSVLKRVRPACNTMNMGGSRGTWPSSERCAECGDCLLDKTGGICPITSCSKSMVNGPCGGTTPEGKCEVDRKRDCGWYAIYTRLKDLGALEQMKEIVPAKKYKNYLPTHEAMTGPHWAVDVPAAKGGKDE